MRWHIMFSHNLASNPVERAGGHGVATCKMLNYFKLKFKFPANFASDQVQTIEYSALEGIAVHDVSGQR